MPRLQTAVLCNAATVEASGLVSMLGAFVDSISGPALPVRHQLWVVARLHLFPEDISVDQVIEIEVVAQEGGATLASLNGVVRAEPTPGLDPEMIAGAPIVVPLAVEFPAPGMYHVTFKLNGDLLWDAPLRVNVR